MTFDGTSPGPTSGNGYALQNVLDGTYQNAAGVTPPPLVQT